jgi:hypothetical protein
VEPSGTVQVSTGIALPYLLTCYEAVCFENVQVITENSGRVLCMSPVEIPAVISAITCGCPQSLANAGKSA